MCIYIYIPRTQLTSIFEGQPLKTRPFRTKTRVIWVLGIYTWISLSSSKMEGPSRDTHVQTSCLFFPKGKPTKSQRNLEECLAGEGHQKKGILMNLLVSIIFCLQKNVYLPTMPKCSRAKPLALFVFYGFLSFTLQKSPNQTLPTNPTSIVSCLEAIHKFQALAAQEVVVRLGATKLSR